MVEFLDDLDLVMGERERARDRERDWEADGAESAVYLFGKAILFLGAAFFLAAAFFLRLAP